MIWSRSRLRAKRDMTGNAPSFAKLLLRIFLPFAFAYFLSYIFRGVNAVIFPYLERDIGITAADLGLLTSAFFLVFAGCMPVLGVALDRYGPRKVQIVLLAVAAFGSAMFGLAACTLHPSKVTFRSPTTIAGHPEAAVLDNLMAAGVPFRIAEDHHSISMDHDGTPPEGGPLDCRDIPDMVPILSVLAARATGRSALGHVAHVRLKESDRVASMLQLRKMGAKIEFDGNDMTFEGVEQLQGATLSSFNDHRVLMSLAVAGSIATGVTELSYPHAYRISYPEFLDHMNALGIPAAVTGRFAASVGPGTPSGHESR